MYAAPAEGNGPNAEELELYLLGKKRVDKLLKGNEEKVSHPPHSTSLRFTDSVPQLMAAPTNAAPGGSFTSVQNANSVRDTASKIREDPLLAIKRQEQAQYEKILKNPRRLKELRAAREATMTPAPGAKVEKKSKKDETRDERRIRKEAKAAKEGGGRIEESSSKRGRDDREREDERHSRRRHSRSPSPRRRSHHSERDRYDDSRNDRQRSRSRSPRRRSYSRSPPPAPRHDAQEDRKPTLPESDRKPFIPNPHAAPRQSSGPSRYPPPPHNQGRFSAPTPVASEVEIQARKAALDARLAAMQSSANTLSADRNARLAKLEAEDKVKFEAEEAVRGSRGGKNGVGPKFLREQEKAVFGGGMDLGERMKRAGRVGMERD